MTNSSERHANQSLVRLRECLDIYSAALADWRQTMDQATSKIAGLTTAQAQQLADDIDAVQRNRLEYNVIKERVDAGWALYRRLEAQMEFGRPQLGPNAPEQAPLRLN